MKKSVLTITSVLILVVALVCCFVGCQSIDDIKDKAEIIYDDLNENLKTDGNMILLENHTQGMRLTKKRILEEEYDDYGISPLSDTAYTLTATVEPANADDKRVEWILAEADGGSHITISDYVTLSSEGCTATVTCLQPFEYQLLVTVRSLDNPAVEASCTLDYVQRLTGVNVNMPDLDSESLDITYTTESSLYTIPSQLSVQFSNFTMNSNFCVVMSQAIENQKNTTFQAPVCKAMYPEHSNALVNYTSTGVTFTNGNTLYVEGGSGYFGDYYCPNTLIGCFLGFNRQDMAYENITDQDITLAFRSICSSNYIGTVKVTITSSYNSTNYSTVEKTVQVFVDGSAVHIAVSNIILSNSSFVF